MVTKAREVDLISDRDLARERLAIFAGMDIPSTVVRKELIDNEIDVVNERGQKATACCIKIGPTRMLVMDNGNGISTEVKDGTDGKTHLWLACAKMFSSSNYKGVSDTVGANGVGMSIANFTSRRFVVARVKPEKVVGYLFLDGFLAGTDECLDNIKANPKMFTEEDIKLSEMNGDMVDEPTTLEESKFIDAYWNDGFLVDATWNPGGHDNKMFPDEANIPWLVNYIKTRVGEINSGDVHVYVYSDDSLCDQFKKNEYHWNKDKESANYMPSWTERVAEHNAVVLKDGPWHIAFSIDTSMHVDSVVQGAPVDSKFTYDVPIQIQDYVVRMNVPVSFKYLSDEYPKYLDQTKTTVRFPYSQVARAFEKAGDVYKHFYHEAEKAYMAKVISDSDTNNFWPALGNEDVELIVAEGYSPISALKSQRDPMNQACIALRGKILNCWNLDMQKAMRSEVVKQILNQVINFPYSRIIIAADEDDDGSHIKALVFALLARFTNCIQEGRVYCVHSPHYIFTNRNQPIKWSDDANDCPAGWKVRVLKGLGGMSSDEVYQFIMNKETRELIQIGWDEGAYDALDSAFSNGGEEWIATE